MGSWLTTKINFDAAVLADKVGGNVKRAQKWLDNEILKDCTPYVPRITGALERSGIDGTVIGGGLITYNSPYAKKQYYRYYRHSKQAHPQASREWFEVAKAVNKGKWVRGVKRIGGGG